MKVRVQVTQDDIDHGEQKDAYSCAFTRALIRALPNLNVYDTYVIPSGAFLNLLDGGERKRIMLPFPFEVCEWIMSFDQDKDSVHPIEFELDLAYAEEIVDTISVGVSSFTESADESSNQDIEDFHTKKLKIEVTEDDIHYGKQRDYYSCPLALALDRVFGGYNMAGGYNVLVGCACSYVFLPIHQSRVQVLRINFTDEVADWLERFDHDRNSVRPFTFELDLPTLYWSEVMYES